MVSLSDIFAIEDIRHSIKPHLSDEDVFNLRRVNQDFRERFRDIFKRRFNDKYGAIAPCENANATKSIWSLIERIETILNFDSVENGQILHIDSEGKPSWKKSTDLIDG